MYNLYMRVYMPIWTYAYIFHICTYTDTKCTLSLFKNNRYILAAGT